MLHRSQVEWPCLSVDFILRERCSLDGIADSKAWFPNQVLGKLDPAAGNTMVDKQDILKHKNDKFPMEAYFVAGSQADKKVDNRIYVMKWSDMQKTLHEDELASDSEEEEERNRQPIIRFEGVPHRGSINRIRSMHGSPIVATWNEDGEVGIYNVAQAIEALDKPFVKGQQQKKNNYGGSKIAAFRNKAEGYALDWSPNTFGRLATGSNDASLMLYIPTDETCSSFVKETAVGLQSHKGSIEDVQFSPVQEHVLASCSSD